MTHIIIQTGYALCNFDLCHKDCMKIVQDYFQTEAFFYKKCFILPYNKLLHLFHVFSYTRAKSPQNKTCRQCVFRSFMYVRVLKSYFKSESNV